MLSADSGSPAVSRAPSLLRWLVPTLLAVAALIALTAWINARAQRSRLDVQNKSVANYQIRAAAGQFFLEHPRLFVGYEELIGPDRYLKSVRSVAGEDYHELFPILRSTEEFAVTMGDGRRVIVLETGGTVYGMIVQRPNGEFAPDDNPPAALKIYEQWRQGQRRPDGPQVVVSPNEFRLETTYRDGLPDGAFRYFRPDGKLWGEGTYRRGRVVGPYREFDAAGRLLYEGNVTATTR